MHSKMPLKNFVSCATVASILKNGGFSDGYRLIDCTSRLSSRPNHKDYERYLYGQFEKMMNAQTRKNKEYAKRHIPEAVHMDLDTATYPSEYASYALYPPEVFQKYARLLGINRGDQIVLYGRGALGGMMVPSTIAWMFKSYGHNSVSVLDGGFNQWVEEKGEVTDQIPPAKIGDWEASKISKDRVVTYEDLVTKDRFGDDWFTDMDKINFLDSRNRGQFDGSEPTGLDPNKVMGSHVGGARNVPAVDLVTNEGILKPRSEIRKWVEECGVEKGKPVISLCNKGLQASMLAMVLEYLDETTKSRVYFGSMKELEKRDPKKINAGHLFGPSVTI